MAEVPEITDDALITGWGLVVEGYARTMAVVAGDLVRESALPGPWFEVLLRLSHSVDGRQPMTQLAREVSFSSGGFTKLFDRMVGAGLVERRPHPSDRRVVHAALTGYGAEVIAAARARHAESLRRHVLAHLAPHQFGQLADVMRTLRDAAPEGCP